MGALLAKLFQFAQAVIANRGVQVAGGAAAVIDVLNIDVLRREAVRIAPRSDPEALEEASRQIMRMLGLDGSNVIGPKDIRDWNYFHFSVAHQRAWWTKRYTSGRSRRAAFGRGSRRGFGRGQRNIATISQAQGR